MYFSEYFYASREGLATEALTSLAIKVHAAVDRSALMQRYGSIKMCFVQFFRELNSTK